MNQQQVNKTTRKTLAKVKQRKLHKKECKKNLASMS